MTNAIISDHCRGSLASSPRTRTAIPAEAGCPTVTDTQGAGSSVCRSGGFSRTLRVAAPWRDMFFALIGGTAWILAVSMLLPRESPCALSAVFVAATVSSIAGFAFSAVAGGILLHMVDSTVKVVMIMMVCSIAIQSLSVAFLWRDIEWRRLRIVLFGGVAGLPIGVWLLLHLHPSGARSMIGALLIAYAIHGLFRRPVSVRTSHVVWAVLAGCLGGITGGLAGFPGAAVTVWCSRRGWNKRRQRALYQPYILVMQILGLLVIHVAHPAAAPAEQDAIEILPFVPAALLGAWMGLKIFERLSENHFKLAINLLLFISGAGLII